MKDRLVKFASTETWQIKNKLSEKQRVADNYYSWKPSEAHAVYECVQVESFNVGAVAILKLRIQSLESR